jgi:hypothetical protein
MSILFIDESSNTVTRYDEAVTTPHNGEIVCFDEKGTDRWLVLQVIHIMVQCNKHSAIIKIRKI